MPYRDKNRQREYMRNWVKARRLSWVEEHGPCEACGSHTKLQIDHKDPTKKVTHAVWSWAKARRDRELAKCHVLCEVCHLAKSIKEGSVIPATHGTEERYRCGKCRCDMCRAAHAARIRYYRSRAKLRRQGFDPQQVETRLRQEAKYWPKCASPARKLMYHVYKE